jgi:hypothetical protein
LIRLSLNLAGNSLLPSGIALRQNGDRFTTSSAGARGSDRQPEVCGQEVEVLQVDSVVVVEAALRALRKAQDQKRAKCRCKAYPWPHRPGGGLCRWPEPPLECYKPPEGKHRPYHKRYAGLLRQIARANGLHPIRDRERIHALMPRLIVQAKLLKRYHPRCRYRDMEVTEGGGG